MSWGFRLRRAWDEFLVPLPFSRVVIVAHHPIDAERARARPGDLDRAIEVATQSAEKQLAMAR